MRRTRLTAAVLALGAALLLCSCSTRAASEPPPDDVGETSEGIVLDASQITTLSAAQLELISGSIKVTTERAEAEGAAVTMRSAMGDGCNNCFNLSLELPSGTCGTPAGFERAELLFNDDSEDASPVCCEWALSDDDDPADGKYYLRLSICTDRRLNKGSALNNGTPRTLRLVNAVDKDGRVICAGVWELGFEYMLPGSYAELVDEPVSVAGAVDLSTGEEKVWAKLESFLLSDFSAQCRYRLVDKSASEPMSFGLSYVEQSSGQKHFISHISDQSDGQVLTRCYRLSVPVPAEDIKSVHLSEKLTLNAK